MIGSLQSHIYQYSKYLCSSYLFVAPIYDSDVKHMTSGLFGTTGVRKVYGTEFDIEMAMRLGKAFGTYLGDGKIIIARDARTTGEMVVDALTSGLLSTGIDVVKAGIIPTPTLAFLTKKIGFDAGLMVTASHNPPEYTGVKFWNKDSMGFTQDIEKKLEETYFANEFKNAPWDKLGSVSELSNPAEIHIDSLLAHCDAESIKEKKFKVIIDPGNGAACVLTPYLAQKLGCSVITINGQLDGHFPGRPSEPEETTLGDLIRMVKEIGADLGVAHDGDADRVVFVTKSGEVIRGDRTIALLAIHAMAQSENKVVVTTVDSSRALDESIEKHGGKTERTPVGDIQVAVKVKELGAIHGGEACGVFIFPEYHLAPDPFLAFCRVLEIMAKTGKSFDELISNIPIYPLKKSKIKVPNEYKQSVMEKLAEELPKSLTGVKEVLTVDGIGLFLENGWVLVRPSGTEPVIRITCEGQSENEVIGILESTQTIVERVVETLR